MQSPNLKIIFQLINFLCGRISAFHDQSMLSKTFGCFFFEFVTLLYENHESLCGLLLLLLYLYLEGQYLMDYGTVLNLLMVWLWVALLLWLDMFGYFNLVGSSLRSWVLSLTMQLMKTACHWILLRIKFPWWLQSIEILFPILEWFWCLLLDLLNLI